MRKSKRDDQHLPPGRYAAFGAKLQAQAGRLHAVAMSHFIARDRGVLLLSATTLEPRGFLSLAATRRFHQFPSLAREAGGYDPKVQTLVLALDGRHAMLFLLQIHPLRGRPAWVDLLGGGAAAECLRFSVAAAPRSSATAESATRNYASASASARSATHVIRFVRIGATHRAPSRTPRTFALSRPGGRFSLSLPAG